MRYPTLIWNCCGWPIFRKDLNQRTRINGPISSEVLALQVQRRRKKGSVYLENTCRQRHSLLSRTSVKTVIRSRWKKGLRARDENLAKVRKTASYVSAERQHWKTTSNMTEEWLEVKWGTLLAPKTRPESHYNHLMSHYLLQPTHPTYLNFRSMNSIRSGFKDSRSQCIIAIIALRENDESMTPSQWHRCQPSSPSSAPWRLHHPPTTSMSS